MPESTIIHFISYLKCTSWQEAGGSECFWHCLSTNYKLHPYILLQSWIIKATKGGDLSRVCKAQDFPAPEVLREAWPLDIYVLCDKIKN